MKGRMLAVIFIFGILSIEEYRLWEYKEAHPPCKINVPDSQTHTCVKCGQPNTIYFHWVKDTLQIQNNDTIRNDSIYFQTRK